MFSTDFIFRQQENLVDNQKCQAGFRPLCNKMLLKNLVQRCSKYLDDKQTRVPAILDFTATIKSFTTFGRSKVQEKIADSKLLNWFKIYTGGRLAKYCLLSRMQKPHRTYFLVPFLQCISKFKMLLTN